jgi:hypothetical protein
MQEYPASNFSSVYWATSRALGDSQVHDFPPACLAPSLFFSFLPSCFQMSCYARNSARWLTAGRQSNPNPAPVFMYFFNHTLEVVQIFAPDKGCFHGSELAFVFDLELALWSSEERALAQAFVKYAIACCCLLFMLGLVKFGPLWCAGTGRRLRRPVCHHLKACPRGHSSPWTTRCMVCWTRGPS